MTEGGHHCKEQLRNYMRTCFLYMLVITCDCACDLHAYKIQLHQKVKPHDRTVRMKFAETILAKIDANDTFLDWVCFSD